MSDERFSNADSRIELLAPVSGGWSHGIRHMEGSEDAIEPWRSLIVNPKGFFPGFVSDPCVSNSVPDVPRHLESNSKNDDCDSTPNPEYKLEENKNGYSSVMGTDDSAVKSGGRIAERRAASGFDALKVNTTMFKSSRALVSCASASPYLLQTPGISPSVLLESPLMLSNLQPSPTTGAFALPHLACESGVIRSESSSVDNDSDDTSSFTFNPHHDKPVPLLCYSTMQNQYPPSSSAQNSGFELDLQHAAATLPPTTGGFEFPTQLPSEATVNTCEFNSPPDSKISSDMVVNAISNDFQMSDSAVAAGGEIQQNEYNQGEDAGNSGIDHPMDGDQKVMDASRGAVGNSEDGYNWRKYGQKQVKASEFPRSYYKCTQPSCPVKKKVEHSLDGQIIEIVYKGAHNHPLPQPNRRSTFGSSVSCGESLNVGEGGGFLKGESGAGWKDSQHGYPDLKLGSDRRPGGLERTCSASIITEASDPLSANEGNPAGALESAGTPELSSTLASNEEVEEEDATTGSTLIVADDDNEPDLKRRKMENSFIETVLASRAIREPRVIVQIESEVDILDDGYRWRKYGQKVVKGNPNPRSYYKCTHPGCGVRKHVERASHNLKYVLTTYEGKHNHEVPSARNSSHASSVVGNSAPSVPDLQEALTFPRNCHLPKSEQQAFATHLDRKDFLKPKYIGNLAGGATAFYHMKFPTFPNPMFYGAFGVNPNQEYSTAPMVSTGPSLPIPPPLGFTLSSNMAFPNDSQGRPLGMIQPMFLEQPPKDEDAKLPRPMQD